jgi:hypothetical protein
VTRQYERRHLKWARAYRSRYGLPNEKTWELRVYSRLIGELSRHNIAVGGVYWTAIGQPDPTAPQRPRFPNGAHRDWQYLVEIPDDASLAQAKRLMINALVLGVTP